MLFIGDRTVSGSDIRDHLRELYHIKESRGIRKHLAELCDTGYLEKNTTKGISSYYKWRKSLNAFKEIIDLISFNSELVAKIMKEKYYNFKNKSSQPSVMTLFRPWTISDSTRYWYNTDYAKSFFTHKTINTVLRTAYKLYSENKRSYTLTKSQFRHIIFEGHDNQTLVALMHYSPNLVEYIIDLRDRYKEKTSDLKKITHQIFLTTIYDILFGSTAHHVGFTFMEGRKLPKRPLSVTFSASRPQISKKVEDGVLKEIELTFGCSLPAPGIQNLIRRKGT